jgi:hypothetical protein
VIASLVSGNARGMLDVLVRRLDGLTDEELHWEPVGGCMGVRAGAMDPLPRAPHHYDGDALPDPITTIAWRLAHITVDGLLNPRNAEWLGADVQAPAVASIPMTASEIVPWVAAAIDWWCDLLSSLSDEHLSEPIGPIGGAFGDAPRAGFVLHIGNDTTHHAAEVALLRDLWRAGVR